MAEHRAHGPSTIITGHANAPLCNADRLWLQSYIYAEGAAPKADYVPKQFAQALYAVPKHWEKTAEPEKPSGLRAEMWERPVSRRKASVCASIGKQPVACSAPLHRGGTGPAI